jgi:hypothetical protein
MPIKLGVLITAVLTLAGCATVATDVTVLGTPAARAPTQNVAILLEQPSRPYEALALIEARGYAGGSEGELLQAARHEAAKLGADAVVRLSVDRVELPPVEVYDPLLMPFDAPYYWFNGGPYFYPPYLAAPRLVAGGTALSLRALAIAYRPAGK